MIIRAKTHIKCSVSHIRVDATGCNDCDICGGPPTYDTPVLQLRIERVLTRVRGRKPYNDATMVSVHQGCVGHWFGYYEIHKGDLTPA